LGTSAPTVEESIGSHNKRSCSKLARDSQGGVQRPIGSPLGVTLPAELPDRAQWLVPTIVHLDFAKWLMASLARTKRTG
jgi:hypothetical protein